MAPVVCVWHCVDHPSPHHATCTGEHELSASVHVCLRHPFSGAREARDHCQAVCSGARRVLARRHRANQSLKLLAREASPRQTEALAAATSTLRWLPPWCVCRCSVSTPAPLTKHNLPRRQHQCVLRSALAAAMLQRRLSPPRCFCGGSRRRHAPAEALAAAVLQRRLSPPQRPQGGSTTKALDAVRVRRAAGGLRRLSPPRGFSEDLGACPQGGACLTEDAGARS